MNTEIPFIENWEIILNLSILGVLIFYIDIILVLQYSVEFKRWFVLPGTKCAKKAFPKSINYTAGWVHGPMLLVTNSDHHAELKIDQTRLHFGLWNLTWSSSGGSTGSCASWDVLLLTSIVQDGCLSYCSLSVRVNHYDQYEDFLLCRGQKNPRRSAFIVVLKPAPAVI